MRSGWKSLDPRALSDYDDGDRTLTVQLWVVNLLWGDSPVDLQGDVFQMLMDVDDASEFYELPNEAPEALQGWLPKESRLSRSLRAQQEGKDAPDESSEDDDQDGPATASRTQRHGRVRTLKRGARSQRSSRAHSLSSGLVVLSTDDEDSDVSGRKQRGRKRKGVQESTRRSTRKSLQVQGYEEDEEEEDTDNSSASDILHFDLGAGRKRKRRAMMARARDSHAFRERPARRTPG